VSEPPANPIVRRGALIGAIVALLVSPYFF
jgi:hypothetical protein